MHPNVYSAKVRLHFSFLSFKKKSTSQETRLFLDINLTTLRNNDRAKPERTKLNNNNITSCIIFILISECPCWIFWSTWLRPTKSLQAATSYTSRTRKAGRLPTSPALQSVIDPLGFSLCYTNLRSIFAFFFLLASSYNNDLFWWPKKVPSTLIQCTLSRRIDWEAIDPPSPMVLHASVPATFLWANRLLHISSSPASAYRSFTHIQ